MNFKSFNINTGKVASDTAG